MESDFFLLERVVLVLILFTHLDNHVVVIDHEIIYYVFLKLVVPHKS